MSIMGGRKDRHQLLDGIPQSQASMALGRSAFIDVTKEIPLDAQPQPGAAYDGGQPHINSMSSYQMPPSAPGSRHQSMSSAIGRRFRKPHFAHGRRGSKDAAGDNDDFNGDANVAMNGAEPDMSLGDLRHLRGGGRYGGAAANPNSSIDTLSYVPTYNGMPAGAGAGAGAGMGMGMGMGAGASAQGKGRQLAQMSNTAYRKQQMMQKKLNAMRMTQRGGGSYASGGAYAPGGGAPRTMSLQSFGGAGYGRRMGPPGAYQGQLRGPGAGPGAAQGHLNSMGALSPRPPMHGAGMQPGMGAPAQPGPPAGYPRAMSMQTTGYYRRRANAPARYNGAVPQFRRPPFGNPSGQPRAQRISPSDSQNSASSFSGGETEKNMQMQMQNQLHYQNQTPYSLNSSQSAQNSSQSAQNSFQDIPNPSHSPNPSHTKNPSHAPIPPQHAPIPPQHVQNQPFHIQNQDTYNNSRTPIQNSNPPTLNSGTLDPGSRHADFSQNSQQNLQKTAQQENQPRNSRSSFSQELGSVPEQRGLYVERGEADSRPKNQKRQLSNLADGKIPAPMHSKPSQLPPDPSRSSRDSFGSIQDEYGYSGKDFFADKSEKSSFRENDSAREKNFGDKSSFRDRNSSRDDYGINQDKHDRYQGNDYTHQDNYGIQANQIQANNDAYQSNYGIPHNYSQNGSEDDYPNRETNLKPASAKGKVFKPQAGHVKVNRYDFSDSDDEEEETEENFDRVPEPKAHSVKDSPFRSSSSILEGKNTGSYSAGKSAFRSGSRSGSISGRSSRSVSRRSSRSGSRRSSRSVSGRSSISRTSSQSMPYVPNRAQAESFKVPAAPALANETSSFTSSSTSYSDSIRKTPNMTLKTYGGRDDDSDEIEQLSLDNGQEKKERSESYRSDEKERSESYKSEEKKRSESYKNDEKDRNEKPEKFNENNTIQKSTYSGMSGSLDFRESPKHRENKSRVFDPQVSKQATFGNPLGAVSDSDASISDDLDSISVRRSFKEKRLPQHPADSTSSESGLGMPNSFGSSLHSKASKTSSNLTRKPPPLPKDPASEIRQMQFSSLSPNPQAVIPSPTPQKQSSEGHFGNHRRSSSRHKSSNTLSSIENAIARSPRVAGAKHFFRKLAHKNIRHLSRGHSSNGDKISGEDFNKHVSRPSVDFNNYPPLPEKKGEKPLSVKVNALPKANALSELNALPKANAPPEVNAHSKENALPTANALHETKPLPVPSELRSPVNLKYSSKPESSPNLKVSSPAKRQVQNPQPPLPPPKSPTQDSLMNYRLTLRISQDEEEDADSDHRLSKLLGMNTDVGRLNTENTTETSPKRRFKRGSPSSLVADKRYTNLSQLTRDSQNTKSAEDASQPAKNTPNGMRNESTETQAELGENLDLRRYLDPSQQGILTDTEKIMRELQVVSTELASSISRELSLESKLKSEENLSPSILYETNAGSKIADLVKQLNGERSKRYAVEQTLLKVANGTSFGSEVTRLNYENSELRKQVVDLEEGQKSSSKKLQLLLEEKESLSTKLDDMTEQFKNLTNDVIPGLKNRIEILSSSNAPKESLEEQVSSLKLQNENLKQKQVTQDDDNTTIKKQRDSLREAIKSLRVQNEVNLRLHTEKVKTLEQRLSTLSTLNAELSKKMIASGLVSRSDLSVLSSPNVRNNASFNQKA